MASVEQNSSGPPKSGYAWASITIDTCNYGNWLIEYCLKEILDLPEPAITFDSFLPLADPLIEQINQTCKFVLSPGCTTLQMGQNAAYTAFDKIKPPTPCFGGCLWQSGQISHLSKQLNMLAPAQLAMRQGKTARADLTVAAKMSQPIGSRDPYTHKILTEAGIASRFVGCPTLIAPQAVTHWRKPAGERLIMSLSRSSVPAQLRLIRKLSRSWNVHIVIHEPYERKIMKLLPKIATINFEHPKQLLDAYCSADIVVTGRLHGALPAIRCGVPVAFFGNPSDSRLSLLEFLGIPLRISTERLAIPEDLPEIQIPSPQTFDKLQSLREAFVEYAEEYGIETKISL